MSEDESVGDAENDLEVILEGDQDNEEQSENVNVATNNGSQENAEGETKKVKPKRVIKNPQPKLNEQTLKGPRGLAAIESYFERVKFKERGYEEQDLNTLLKTYEYWCHRLFPKFPFDNCIERLEKLGTKRATQTQIKKIRMGLNFDELAMNAIVNEEEHGTEGFVDTYNDQFEPVVSTADTEPEVTEDQLERMRQNMERAKRLREERLRKLAENTQNNLTVANQMNTQDGEHSHLDSSINTQNITEAQKFDEAQIETALNRNETEDNEDDIENILSYINTNQNKKDSAESQKNLESIGDDSTSLMEIESDETGKELRVHNVNEISENNENSLTNQEKNASATDLNVSQDEDVHNVNSVVENMQTSESSF